MKKDNKGFVLLETLMVSTFIIVVLIYLYIQFSSIKQSYSKSFKYDTISSLYSLKEVDKFINDKFGYSELKENVDNEENRYIELYNNNKCSLVNFSSDYSYCDKLMENLNIKTLLFISSDTTYLKNKMKTNNPYSNKLYLYLKNLDPNIAKNSYILIAEYKDESFATLKIDSKLPKCIRAKKLHTEICNRDDSNGCIGAGYKKGDTITYGNLGRKGRLQSGDAFDCDVNGDSKYDSKTERFYYVSDYYDTEEKEFNDKYAVLIYYNNTNKGIADNSNDSLISYNVNARENWHGPITAINNLPTKKQWKNINLYNTNRNILNEASQNTSNGGNKELEIFNYNEYSTRLLSISEIKESCGNNIPEYKNGELDSCLYLYQNTKFTNDNLIAGFWLENASYNFATTSWATNSARRLAVQPYVDNSAEYSVRPVIEVHKEDIKY